MDRGELVRRSAELVPALRDRASRTERIRQIPQETLDDLAAAGLLRAQVPGRFGGLGFEYDVALEIATELGRGCGSTGWCYGVWASHVFMLLMYPEDAQEEYWASGPDTLCTSCLNPAGATGIEEVEGGYRLSGRWDFASGCDAAAWTLFLGAHSEGVLSFLVPQFEYEIEDTWYASGLRGSGSKDIILKDVFVPRHRVLSISAMQEARTPGRDIHLSASVRIPLFSGSSYGLVAPVIGMAQGAVEAFQAHMKDRISTPRGGKVAESAALQMRLAESATETWTARLIMRQDLDEILERARSDASSSLEERLRARRNQAYIAVLCIRAVNRLFEESGARALLDDSPLQRFHRDIHASVHHVSLSWDTASEQYGRMLLGLEPTNRRY
jgi:3-hydroxy-9,10-secoandrosta-1,3,5(10)-triene-9,17-dione monooxygenase